MATPLVIPFRGERYVSQESLAEVIAPPYDVISPQERDAFENRNPYNVVSLTLPKGSDPYQAAAKLLRNWRASDIIRKDAEPAVYVLKQIFDSPDGKLARTGVIGALSVEGYSTGRIKPHEKTHARVKADRLALMKATQTMFESLLFIAPDSDETILHLLADATNRPADAQAMLESVENMVWKVTGDAANQLADAAGARHLYIADGHHRYETGSSYREENPSADRTLALIVPSSDPGLVILPTHRMLFDTELSVDQVEESFGSVFDIEHLDSSVNSAEYLSGSWECVVLLGAARLGLRLRTGIDISLVMGEVPTSVKALNVARIDALVTGPLRTLANDCDMGYSASVEEVESRVARDGTLAVVLPGTTIEEVFAVADQGAFMPQKATFFSPKVPSGFVFLSFDSSSQPKSGVS